jgi:hypothetical protein
MAYEVQFDEANQVVVLKVIGAFHVADAAGFHAHADAALGEGTCRQVMVDLGEAGPLQGTETRRATAAHLRELEITHMAMINAKPVVRVFGKVLAKLVGGPIQAGFFASRDDALAWLKAER